ncbi:PleD family two-component system response regulator [Neorickettsia findlayensis]|uniref:diguanylate cyclase n=1 Tax=Neorickettsia findlayensis TaxID=2686014 RepID=A0A6P1GA95_9RICK|nr:PleD family two-component system response regulator [Neorickettsia findlayensis]QHD65232.1 PleD family two-component system response regulator [Neorickettsia findlayensis]
MTALILVVDDIPSNIKILEIKLTAKYYQVITASSGIAAIELARRHQPDVILLDVMMPEMDGFETCKRLKSDYSTMHIPVIIVTALNDIENKVEGLSSGADDFLVKPAKDFTLFIRIKSLLRFKTVLDEVRLRISTKSQITSGTESKIINYVEDVSSGVIAIVNQQYSESKELEEILKPTFPHVLYLTEKEAEYTPFDVLIVNISVSKDLLRLCSAIKSQLKTRSIPIIAIVDDEDDESLIAEITELGINDYICVPINKSEFIARVTTQIKRKKYQDIIEKNVEDSLKMAIIDPLTSLYNRYYFEKYMDELLATVTKSQNKTFSLMMIDIDYFKKINDVCGHLSGDLVLKQLATCLKGCLRLNDLVAKFGGEEIVVVLVDVGLKEAFSTAERIRKTVEKTEFSTINDEVKVPLTVSIGVSEYQSRDTAKTLIGRADANLYIAKEKGRNRVVMSDHCHK